MPSLLDFIPLRIETVESIRARMDADVNAGVDPSDDAFIDTTPGGFYFDVTQAIALEMERLWDMAATEFVAASFVAFSWGDYLDEHGETITVARKAAVKSTGEITFTGTNGTIVAVGTEVSTEQTDPEIEPVSFVTTESGTVSGGTLTLNVEASEAGSAGNVATGAVPLLLTPVTGISAVANAASITGGSDIESDEQYRDRLILEYSAAQGSGSLADYERWSLAFPGVGNVRVAPLWNGGGTVRVVVTDIENDPVSTVVRDGLQVVLDPYSASTTTTGSHTLPVGTINVVSTTGFSPSGKVYVGTNLVTYTGVTSTTFTGCTGGSGSVTAGTDVVQHGQGKGLAPVGAIVTVQTPTTLAVTVSAAVSHADGYSLDGAGGTIATRTNIENALSEYIDNLPPGGENPPGSESPAGSGYVLLNKTESRFFRVPGVYDVSSVQLNAAAANLAVSATQVPELTTVTLT